MTNLALVGDIGGTNSRFGLIELGSMNVRDVEVQKNDNFASLEESITHYVKAKGIGELAAASVDDIGAAAGRATAKAAGVVIDDINIQLALLR